MGPFAVALRNQIGSSVSGVFPFHKLHRHISVLHPYGKMDSAHYRDVPIDIGLRIYELCMYILINTITVKILKVPTKILGN